MIDSLRQWARRRRIRHKYKAGDYLDAYSEHTDYRVEVDHREAVGGRWEEMGQLQFDFLLAEGLQPQHTLLDIGCGTLRGGRHAIAYLAPGNYTGIDISPKAIEFARDFVASQGLTDKQPRLLVNEEKHLRFSNLEGSRFDFLLAQSVFSHLKPPHIDECFAHLDRVMHDGSVFYFTHRLGEYRDGTGKEFDYPFSFFEETAAKHGYAVEDIAERYDHPSGQRMVRCVMQK